MSDWFDPSIQLLKKVKFIDELIDEKEYSIKYVKRIMLKDNELILISLDDGLEVLYLSEEDAKQFPKEIDNTKKYKIKFDNGFKYKRILKTKTETDRASSQTQSEEYKY